MNLDHKSILLQANKAITEGNHEAFLAFCTDDTEWEFMGDQTLQGKQAVREYMTKVYIEPPQFMVEHLIAEGDFLTAIGTISLKDEHGTMTDYDYCDVWQFRDGKLDKLKAFVTHRKVSA
jgi:ketosteroid isomerase-like protein